LRPTRKRFHNGLREDWQIPIVVHSEGARNCPVTVYLHWHRVEMFLLTPLLMVTLCSARFSVPLWASGHSFAAPRRLGGPVELKFAAAR
jgi:hypothetical protein